MSKMCLAVTPLILIGLLRGSAEVTVSAQDVTQQVMRQQQETLTDQNIIRMARAGLGIDVIISIISKINDSEVHFDLSTNGLIVLKEGNVLDEIIRAVMIKQADSGQLDVPALAKKGAPRTSSQSSMSSADAGTAIAPVKFNNAEYSKPTGQGKAKHVKRLLVFDSAAKPARFRSGGVTQFEISYNKITGLLYEQTAKPRYSLGILIAWPLSLTKSKKYFLTIQHKLQDGQGRFAIVRLHKKNFQMALATAEVQTSIEVKRTEER